MTKVRATRERFTFETPDHPIEVKALPVRQYSLATDRDKGVVLICRAGERD